MAHTNIHRHGFTLIELLVCIAIIAILIGMMAPHITSIRDKANLTKCANNLRQLGVAVNLYAADSDGRYPMVESMPTNKVYTDENVNAKPLLETLASYGVTKDLLTCPADVAGPNYLAKEGSSYGWRNWVDDEKIDAMKFYGRRGVRVPNSAWIVIATDYDTVHNGHSNRLYADGHVRRADDTRR